MGLKCPYFWRGFVSVFTFGGWKLQFRLPRKRRPTDAEMLRRDWEKVLGDWSKTPKG